MQREGDEIIASAYVHPNDSTQESIIAQPSVVRRGRRVDSAAASGSPPHAVLGPGETGRRERCVIGRKDRDIKSWGVQ